MNIMQNFKDGDKISGHILSICYSSDSLFLIAKDVSFCYCAYYFFLTVNKSCVESLALPDIVEKNVDKFEFEKTMSPEICEKLWKMI